VTHVDRSPVRRECTDTRGNPLVVGLTREGIWVREKGRRTAYLVTYGAIHSLGAKQAAEAIRREKLAKRKEKALARRIR